MKIFTLETLAELTQELLNDPNLVHRNMIEKATIYGHAAEVLAAQRYAVTLEGMKDTMLSALKAQETVDPFDAQAQTPSWAQLVSDELEALHRFALALPESERVKVIPAWTEEELWAVRKDPPKEFGELCSAIREAVTGHHKWDGCAKVFIRLEELTALGFDKVPTWSARPDLAELHRRLEWALQSIKAQESSQ